MFILVAEQEIVILSQVIAHKLNIGYVGYNDFRLKSLNNETIINLQHLKTKLDKIKQNLNNEKYLKFEFTNDYIIVLDAELSFETQDEVSSKYNSYSVFD